jgi:protein-S-isoprenylcysteine O-methyltransferase Ste14
MYKKFILPPPVIDLIFLGLAVFLNIYFPYKIIYPPYSFISGIIILIASGVLILLSIILFYKNRTAIFPGFSPSKIITKGPFRISRNPIYLGMVVMFVGLSFLFGSLAVFIVPILNFIILNFYVIPIEERICEEDLGAEYLRYKENVRRWI